MAPAVLSAIAGVNKGPALAYGADAATDRVESLMSALFDSDVDTLFAFNGTGANVLALGCLLEAGDSVLCVDTAHIHTDEAAAPERVLGTKIVTVPGVDGKLTVDSIRSCVTDTAEVHHPRVGVVSISQVTEMGTVYSPAEVRALADAAHSVGLRLHMDGARIANAVAAKGGDTETLRAMTVGAGVDALSFGATKNGGMYGEAVVLFSPTGKKNHKYLRKQYTQLPSKMRYVSAQFEALLSDNLWLDLASHANTMAAQLFEATSMHQDLNLTAPQANSLFPTMRADAATALSAWSFFWPWRPELSQYRWMTSWETTPDDVARFAEGITRVLQGA